MLRKIMNVNRKNNVHAFLVNCRSVTFSRTPLRVLKKSELTSRGRPRPLKKSAPPQVGLRPSAMKAQADNQRVYEKLDENDDTFLKVMTALKSKKKREKNAQILLEGRRLIMDAIEAKVPVECIYFSNEDQLEDIPLRKLPEDVRLIKASSHQMQIWSDLTTCPGIMGIFKMPNYDDLTDPEKKSHFPVSIVCDKIREPGNMGSILRCAAAVGCYKVYVTKGCVDVWDTKVLRTGCGAHFRVPIVKTDWDSIANYLSSDVALYLADNCTVPPSRTRNVTPIHHYTDVAYGACEAVVVVGGETDGLSEEAEELASQHAGVRTVIPMENNVDSLNSAMALSIILFEMKRQYRAFLRERRKSEIKD